MSEDTTTAETPAPAELTPEPLPAVDDRQALETRLADAEHRNTQLEARATVAERRAALTGRVQDIELAMSVADRYVNDGRLDVDALVTAHPALAPAAPRPATLPGAPAPAAAARPLTLETLENLSPSEINARWDEARAQLGPRRK